MANYRTFLFLLVFVFGAGCAPEASQDTAPLPDQTPAQEAADEPEPPAVSVDIVLSELAGTAWQLLQIMSMDDTTDIPDDRSRYTLEFGVDGAATMLADCNRGKGSWISESAGQLQFGPIASTRAMCPPGSLSEKYLEQFQWVRSYVLKEGHLFLATMADGSIIEFEPVETEPLAATVLGEEVRTGDPGEMQQTVITRLFDDYSAKHGIEVTETEISTYVQNLKRAMAADENLTAENDLTPEEARQVSEMRSDMAHSIIWQWKINRELYGQYGGRIIYQQLGPEPLDAYRQYFEEQQRAGNFSIHDPAMETAFWRYFTDESIHSFMEPGSDDEKRAFQIPPWEQMSLSN